MTPMWGKEIFVIIIIVILFQAFWLSGQSLYCRTTARVVETETETVAHEKGNQF